MELEHLVGKWCVGHHVPTYVPWDNVCIHGLHIAFTCLIVDSIVGECIFGNGGTQTRHETGELLLIKTGVHHKDIVSVGGLQS